MRIVDNKDFVENCFNWSVKNEIDYEEERCWSRDG